jgi:hypothetical protein
MERGRPVPEIVPGRTGRQSFEGADEATGPDWTAGREPTVHAQRNDGSSLGPQTMCEVLWLK